MELKRILARDSRSATEKAMALYGPDVLVIANHSIDGQTELIVAIDIAPEAPAALVREEPRASFEAMAPARVHKPASGNMQAFEEAMALVRNTQAAVSEAPARAATSATRLADAGAAATHRSAEARAPSENVAPRASGRRSRRSADEAATVFWGDMAIPTLADMGAPPEKKPAAPQRRRTAAAVPDGSAQATPAPQHASDAPTDFDWQVPGVGDITIAPRSTARRRSAVANGKASAAAPVSTPPENPPTVSAALERAQAAPSRAVVDTSAKPTARRARPSATMNATLAAEAMVQEPTPSRGQVPHTSAADPLTEPKPVTQRAAAKARATAAAPRPRRAAEAQTPPVVESGPEHVQANTEAVLPPAQAVTSVATDVAQAQAQPSSAATAPADSSAQAERGRELVDLVRAEIAALRQEFVTNLQLQQLQAGSAGHPVAEPLMAALDQAGAPAALRALLLESAQSATDVADGARRVRDALAAGLQAQASALPLSGVHALCGPSGAGKSLMAARWLQHAAQDHDSDRLAFISYCDQRPGAWSQTQMLAAQSGVPAYRANSPDALKVLLNELSDRALVVIDTPGTEPLRHAHTLLEQWPDIGLHTVLPADASPATVRRFWSDAQLPWQSLLISKIDESDQPWGLLQELCNRRIPVAGLSDSPHAHTPLQRWRADVLLDRAMAPVEALLPPTDTAAPDGAPVDRPMLERHGLDRPAGAHAPPTAPLAPGAVLRAVAVRARPDVASRTPPPAMVLTLQDPGRRRHDPHGTAAPKQRPRPEWVAA